MYKYILYNKNKAKYIPTNNQKIYAKLLTTFM